MDGSIADARFANVAASAAKAAEAAGGGALCIYLEGRPVVDIWSGTRDSDTGARWTSDTMAMAWSTTKGVASTVLHMLAERGALDHAAPVATYWPEFGVNGKERLTVRQFMAMEAGLYDVRHLVADPLDLLDHDTMAAAIASARPLHEPGRASAYHALTYGWIAGELVRRVTGTTLGSFLRQEIAEPLQLDGCYIGLPPSELVRVASRPHTGPEPALVRTMAKLVDPVTRHAGISPARIAAAFLPRGAHSVLPTDEFLAAEVPSVNGVFTARSLARLYAALGSDDGLDGVQLWSPETRRLATAPQTRRRDLVLAIRTQWLLGYHQPFPKKRTEPGAFGFYGAYGSGAYADPGRGLAVGFVARQAKALPLPKLVREIDKIFSQS